MEHGTPGSCWDQMRCHLFGHCTQCQEHCKLVAVHSSVPPGDPRHRFHEAASCSQATLALLRAGSGPLALWRPTLYPPQHSPRWPVPLGSSPSLVSFPLAPLPSGCLFFFLFFFSSTFSSPEVSGRGQSFLRESLTPLCQAAVPPPLPLPTTVGRWTVGETVHPERGGVTTWTHSQERGRP